MKSIYIAAFNSCTSLASVTIGENVSSIGNHAFGNCSGLKSVKVERKTPVNLTEIHTFTYRKQATLYVPYGCKSTYEVADVWKEFKEIVEMDPTEKTININQYGSGTYCSESALDFTNVEGLKAYAATGYNSKTNVVTLTRVMTAKANTGLFIKGEAGDYVVQVLEESDDNSLNMLVGTLENTYLKPTTDDGNYANLIYALDDGVPTFMRVSEDGTSYSSANRAYLQIPTAWLPTTSEAKTVRIAFDDSETTGIEENYELGDTNSDAAVYDMMGRKVVNPTKGLYIKNGKKIFIK